MSLSRVELAVVCFIKNPVAGKVKTRLARTVGNEEALNIYHRLLRYTKGVLDPFPGEKKLYFSSHLETLPYWKDPTYEQKLQSGGHLGERLSTAFSNELAKAEKVIIIGSDCAELKTQHLRQASEALNHREVVIGPARDGGYYLIGLNKYIPGIFEGMPWSEPDLLNQTLVYLQEQKISCQLLEELSDVDQFKDWQQVDWK